MNNNQSPEVVLLAGGVGGAKLGDGLAQILPPENLTVVVNTGDDFNHLGLTICPDLDTVLYTLAGVANPVTGWGREGESWRTLEEMERLGGPAWFRLGDLDLAVHLTRSQMLARGMTLTAITRHLCEQFGVHQAILPMCNEPAPTLIESNEGLLAFQTWFVEKRWVPAVKSVQLPEDVRATPAVLKAIEKADLVIFAPSNPFVSIDPILNTYPIREMVTDLPDLVVAVSPIIGGAAVKGPAAKMMQEMGMPVTAQSIANYYHDLIDIFVYDWQDDGMVLNQDHALLCTQTLMRNKADRAQLAQTILNYCMEIAKG